jgi:hypothetical protein
LAAAVLMLAGCVTTGGGQASNRTQVAAGSPAPQPRSAGNTAGNTASNNAGSSAGAQAAAILGSILGQAGSNNTARQPGNARPGVLKPLLPSDVLPAATRSALALQALMVKGRVRGDELLDEVKAMRVAASSERSASAMAAFFGSVDRARVTGKDPKAALIKGLVDVSLALLKERATSLAYNELDTHLQTLIDDPNLLRAQFIQLPKPQGLDRVQQQRAVTMGAILVLTRITGQILKKAQADFVGIETEYQQLLQRREKAASLLYQTLSRGGDGAQQVQGLSDKDVAFLNGSLMRLSVAEFSKDLAAQNMALAYLERTDPGAFREYRAQSEGLLGKSRGYLRLAGGSLAFGAMLVVFTQQVASVLAGKNGDEINALLPLAAEFVREIPPLAKLAFDAGTEGVKLPFKTTMLFRVGDGNAPVDVAGASEVFATIKKRQAEAELRESLFRNGASGLLHKVYMCSPAEAGRMLDTAVSGGDREAFARTFFSEDLPRYSFANSFDAPPQNARPKEREMGDELLRDDHRIRTREATQAFAKLQKAVSDGGYERWGNEQLMRLIFANREGTVQNATLELGGTVVRPIASAQTVFAYESLVDLCRQVVQAAPAAAPAAVRSPAEATPPQPSRPVQPTRPALPARPAVPATVPGRI